MTSAICFNLDKSKILSSGYVIMHSAFSFPLYFLIARYTCKLDVEAQASRLLPDCAPDLNHGKVWYTLNFLLVMALYKHPSWGNLGMDCDIGHKVKLKDSFLASGLPIIVI